MNNNICIDNLNIYFKTKYGDVRAVDHVSLEFHFGKINALIGETGSGKSVLGLSLLGLLADNAVIDGKVIYKKDDLLKLSQKAFQAIRGREIALIPQNPDTSLNPTMKVGKQVAEGINLHQGKGMKEAWKKALSLIEGFMLPAILAKSYPFELSGGMKQRILAAVGISGNPDWIVADEPTKGLDAVVRKQVAETFRKIKEDREMGMVLITHDLLLAGNLADRIAVMYAGDILEIGDAKEVLGDPKHPYTIGLVNSQPHKGMVAMEGFAPSLIKPPKGCKFYPRCPYAKDRCGSEKPGFYHLQNGWKVRCFLFA